MLIIKLIHFTVRAENMTQTCVRACLYDKHDHAEYNVLKAGWKKAPFIHLSNQSELNSIYLSIQKPHRTIDKRAHTDIAAESKIYLQTSTASTL